jgi:hypothetical protein
MGSLSAKNLSKKFSRLGTFKKRSAAQCENGKKAYKKDVAFKTLKAPQL